MGTRSNHISHSDRQTELRLDQTQILEQQSKLSVILEDLAASHRRLEISVADGPLRLKDDIIASLQGILAEGSNSDQAENLRWHALPA